MPYAKEQLWKLFDKLPAELKEAVFSEETASNIWTVCENRDIDDVPSVAKLTGNVLMGLLPPDDFQKTLESELKLDKETSQKVAREINRFVFYPVKTALEGLYKTEIKPPVGGAAAAPAQNAEGIEAGEPASVKPGLRREDAYRESID